MNRISSLKIEAKIKKAKSEQDDNIINSFELRKNSPPFTNGELLNLSKDIKPPRIVRQVIPFAFFFAVVIFSIGLFAQKLPLQSFIVAIFFTIILLVILGVFSLKVNEQFSEKSTVELIKIVLKQLPLQIIEIFNKIKG